MASKESGDTNSAYLCLYQNNASSNNGKWIFASRNTPNLGFYNIGLGRDAMTILPGGNVGIGNGNPGTYLLTMEASGGGYYNQSTHGWVNGSSGRWKSDVEPIANALDTVLKLNGVSFKWKKRTDIFENSSDGTKVYVSSSWEDDPKGRDDIGLIGEDVAKVLPQVVDMDQKDSSLVTGVDYSKMVAVLIEAIKEQQKAIEDLQVQVKKLSGQ